MSLNITIRGNVPSQKNRKKLATNSMGKPYSYTERGVKLWQDSAAWQLRPQKKKDYIKNYPVCVEMVFHFKDNRRHDLDNAASTVLDALVKAGFIKDDDSKHVGMVCLYADSIDKNNPRVNISISDLKV